MGDIPPGSEASRVSKEDDLAATRLLAKLRAVGLPADATDVDQVQDTFWYSMYASDLKRSEGLTEDHEDMLMRAWPGCTPSKLVVTKGVLAFDTLKNIVANARLKIAQQFADETAGVVSLKKWRNLLREWQDYYNPGKEIVIPEASAERETFLAEILLRRQALFGKDVIDDVPRLPFFPKPADWKALLDKEPPPSKRVKMEPPRARKRGEAKKAEAEGHESPKKHKVQKEDEGDRGRSKTPEEPELEEQDEEVDVGATASKTSTTSKTMTRAWARSRAESPPRSQARKRALGKRTRRPVRRQAPRVRAKAPRVEVNYQALWV